MPRQNRSLSLTDVVAVVAVLLMLVSLSLGGYRHAQKTHSRVTTVFTHAGCLRVLEEVKAATGDYPEPAHPDATAIIGGKLYRIGGAMMLYQLLSLDGANEVKGTASTGKPSNGTLTDDGAVVPVWPNLIQNPQAWRLVDGHYFLVDDFGHPMQYQKGGTPDAVNPTFDLWSTAEDSEGANQYSSAIKSNAVLTAKWIKNF
jgi:hypothetical protein